MKNDHRRVIFWSALDERDRADLWQRGRVQYYPADTVIFSQDSIATSVLILLKGCVKVTMHDRYGYQVVLAFRDVGDILGELALTDGSLQSATVCTLPPVEALVVGADQFLQFVRTRPDASLVLQRCLSSRLREADRHRASSSANVSRRLAALLLELGSRHGDREENGTIAINLPLSQEDLAGFLVISRRTVARALESWRERGLVTTGRRSIVIANPQALTQIAAQL